MGGLCVSHTSALRIQALELRWKCQEQLEVNSDVLKINHRSTELKMILHCQEGNKDQTGDVLILPLCVCISYIHYICTQLS